MAIPTIGQESSLGVLLSGSGPVTLTFAGAIQAGSNIVVFVSAWHNGETSGIVDTVTDSASNTYSLLTSIEDDSTAHSFTEAFLLLNSPAQAAGATLTIACKLTSPAVNRITAVAYEIRGADTTQVGAQASDAAGGNATSIALAMPALGGADRLVMYATGSLSTGGASGYTAPSGYTVQEVVTDTTDGRQALLVASRGYATDPGATTITTTMATRLYGATAYAVAFLPGVATVLRVEAEAGAAILGGTEPVFDVCTLPANANQIFGAKLFSASGASVTIGTAVNGNGRVPVQIAIPAGVSLSAGDDVVVIGRARNPADGSAWYGSHVIAADVVAVGA